MTTALEEEATTMSPEVETSLVQAKALISEADLLYQQSDAARGEILNKPKGDEQTEAVDRGNDKEHKGNLNWVTVRELANTHPEILPLLTAVHPRSLMQLRQIRENVADEHDGTHEAL